MSALVARDPRPGRPRVWHRIAVAVSLLMCGPGLALADGRAGHESLNLDRGSLRVGGALAVGLDIRSAGKPMALAPDAYVGVTRRLTLGLVHSGRALGRLGSGWGLCLTGRSGRCDRVVSGTGLDGWYTFLRLRRFELAARSRLYAARYGEPLKLRMTLGLVGLVRVGPVALRFDPHVAVGLVNRELGNAHTLNVPIHLFVALGRYVAIYLRTGLRGMLRTFADHYAIPVGLGVLVRPNDRWRLGAQFVLRQILGAQNTYKTRDLLVYADYRFASFF